MSTEAINTSETNRSYWDSKASTYNSSEGYDELSIGIKEALQTNASWIGIPSSGKVLDFACGPGLITTIIASISPSLTFRGIDISEKMVAEYNRRHHETGSGDAMAVQVDLMDSKAYAPGSPIKGADWLDFDMAAVANSLHHIEKTDVAVARLVERLKVGGVLCVIDWIDDGSKHGHGHGHGHGPGHGHGLGRHKQEVGKSDDQEALLKSHGVAHSHGFTKERILELLSNAGCEDVGYMPIDTAFQFGPFERRIFIAKGKKAAPTKLGFSKATSFVLMH